MLRRCACGLLLAVAVLVPAVSLGCGGSAASNGPDGGHKDSGRPTPDASSTGKDAGPDVAEGGLADATDTMSVSTTYPAPHPPLPQEQTGGGATLASPVFIPITFPADPNVSDITAFTSAIGGSTFWSTIVSQYGVGAATSGTPIVLMASEEPSGTGGTIADSEVQSWLQGLLTSGRLVGTNTANTVYAIYFPAGTTITLQQGGQTATSCTQFGGYHNGFQLPGGANVSYVVVPRCGSFPTATITLTGLDAITGAASHEYLEAVTDPQPTSFSPGYVEPDINDIVWALVLGGGEIGDMCAQNPGVFYKPSDLAYTVQRSWSNSAAAAGHDPCQPSLPGEVYFNSVAVLPMTNVTVQGQSFATHAVSVPTGGKQTVEVDLYSDAATSGPWTVQAIDAAELLGGAPALSFSWDKTTGQNGEKLHLTIQANGPSPFGGWDAFVLVSQLGAQASLSVGMVAMP